MSSPATSKVTYRLEQQPDAGSPGKGLAWKGKKIVARIQLPSGKWTWRGTGTDKPALARRWKEKWDRDQWLLKSGLLPKPAAAVCAEPVLVNALFDSYAEAGHPTVKKRGLKAKSVRSVRNEEYLLTPLREFFGSKDARQLGNNDCDEYRRWRNSGGYVAHFTVRGKPVTKQTWGGDRAVDLELIVLSNALQLAVRRGVLPANPIRDRGQYADDSKVRHCREVAPTPKGLILIIDWLEENDFQAYADLTRFLAYTGLRISEGLRVVWADVKWKDEVIDVHRSKKGICPWAPILLETRELLRAMRRRRKGDLLFPSPFDFAVALNDSSFRTRLAQAARKCGLPHVTPQGLRSYFVTQARQSGLTDAEIAMLIGDRSGPSLIAEVYGDVRPDHLFAVARKIRITACTRSVRNPRK